MGKKPSQELVQPILPGIAPDWPKIPQIESPDTFTQEPLIGLGVEEPGVTKPQHEPNPNIPNTDNLDHQIIDPDTEVVSETEEDPEDSYRANDDIGGPGEVSPDLNPHERVNKPAWLKPRRPRDQRRG